MRRRAPAPRPQRCRRESKRSRVRGQPAREWFPALAVGKKLAPANPSTTGRCLPRSAYRASASRTLRQKFARRISSSSIVEERQAQASPRPRSRLSEYGGPAVVLPTNSFEQKPDRLSKGARDRGGPFATLPP